MKIMLTITSFELFGQEKYIYLFWGVFLYTVFKGI
jgi:hypothetical protein